MVQASQILVSSLLVSDLSKKNFVSISNGGFDLLKTKVFLVLVKWARVHN